MTIDPELDREATLTENRDLPAPDWIEIGFYAIAIVFNLCLVAQIITVGVAYFTDPSWWQIHVWLVRGYSGLSIVLLRWSLLARLSLRICVLAVSLPVLLGCQFFTIHFKTPFHLEIFHPLIGFTLLYISSSLVHRTSRELFHRLDAVTPT